MTFWCGQSDSLPRFVSAPEVENVGLIVIVETKRLGAVKSEVPISGHGRDGRRQFHPWVVGGLGTRLVPSSLSDCTPLVHRRTVWTSGLSVRTDTKHSAHPRDDVASGASARCSRGR